jgi:hypothetical protein
MQKPTFKKSVRYFEKGNYFLVTLLLNIDGNAVLKNLHLTDSCPRGLYYRKNSIRVDDIKQSDAKDRDMAYFDFKVNRLNVDLQSFKLAKSLKVTYILDKEVK